jgi:beta-galactosidase/beta-glucuronidase
MVRKDWQNLNGLWDYAIGAKEQSNTPAKFDGKILVPFPIESSLSGVMQMISETNRLWYRRTFTVPRGWKDKKVLLHFGAVDWESTVFVNGKKVGEHQGGYDGFTFDITDALNPKGENEIVVSVWDPTDIGPQPRGKQVSKPHGIWYTPTSGIWQTVWLEPVSDVALMNIKVTPDVDSHSVKIETLFTPSAEQNEIEVKITDGWRVICKASVKQNRNGGNFAPMQGTIVAAVEHAKLWSPENPHLYGLKLTLRTNGRKTDEVKSYFAMRKISLARDDKGHMRMQLNNTNYFQFGPLDQGFWPDGLYTAPTDDALRYDIEMTKKFGFNMARKHVKVEPDRWYYWCDKLGLLVWQDLPSGDKLAPWKVPSGIDGVEIERTPESKAIYERELKALIETHYNHPSIVVWVPFNEGWGQFDTVRILNLTKQLDPTRLVDGASGGNHFPAGDILDHHQYPGPGAPAPVTDRAMVLGEFGGLGLPLKGHTWQSEKSWGYRSFTNQESLTAAYVDLVNKLHPLAKEHGLSAAIYTQTTDVEIEVNGLMTYDREVIKLDLPRARAANLGQSPPAPKK